MEGPSVNFSSGREPDGFHLQNVLEYISISPDGVLLSHLEDFLKNVPKLEGQEPITFTTLLQFISYKETAGEPRIFLNDKGKKKLRQLRGDPVEYDNVVEKLTAETRKVLWIPPKTKDEWGAFKIFIRDNIIELNSERMGKPDKFCSMYLDRFKERIKIMDNNRDSEWTQIVNYWGSKAVSLKNEIIDKEQILVDSIIDELQRCRITEDIKQASELPGYIYYKKITLFDVPDGERKVPALLFPTKRIQAILRENKMGDITRLQKILEPYLLSNAIIERVGKVIERFWVFDHDQIGISTETIDEMLAQEREEYRKAMEKGGGV